MNLGATGEVGFSLFTGLDGSDEALVDVWRLRGCQRCPFGLVDVFTQADFEFVVGFVQIEAEGAFCAVDAEKKGIRMAGCPAGCVDDTQCAVCIFDLHERGVICIERVFAHAFAFEFGEGFQAGLNAADRPDRE